MDTNLRSEISNYDSLSNEDKISVILGSGNIDVLRNSAKICSNILDRRRHLLFK